MDIYDETKKALVTVWEDNQQRQNAKIVIMEAISNATDVTVKQASEILAEMDRMLLKEKEEPTKRLEKGL